MPKELESLSLFPLHTVLFPGSILQLKIFEQRYLELIKTCMRNNHGFAVVLINDGKEVDDTPSIHSIGTYVEIIDFETLENGLLGITIKAKHKIIIKNNSVQHDGLLHGETAIIDDEDTPVSKTLNSYEHLTTMLQSLTQHPLLSQQYSDINYESLCEISYRLSEFLPTTNINKQALLEVNQVEDRLIKIEALIEQLQM